jgi:hypothetical protein
MSTLKLVGDSSGYVQLVANVAAANNTLTLPNVNDTLANITSPTFLSNIALTGTGTAPIVGLFTPSTNQLAFATNTTQQMVIDAGGNVGIGTNLVNVISRLIVWGDQVSAAGLFTSFWNSDGTNMNVGRARGSVSAPSALLSGDRIGSLIGSGYLSANAASNTASVEFYTEENYSTTAAGSQIRFFTTAPTTVGRSQKMVIQGNGNVGINSSTPTQTLDVQGNVNVLNTVIMGSSFLRNRLINGGMQVAQYGTSCNPGNTATYNYAMDRWFTAINSGSASGYTISQLSQANTSLSGLYNALRYQRNSGQTNTTTMAFGQTIETANCYDLAGQTAVLSFWARAGSNFSAASSQITARVATGTGTDQGSSGAYNGTWTGYAQTNTVVTITTSWVRYSIAVTIPAGVNEIQILFYWAGVGTAGTNDYADFTGIQFEAGPVATAFERRLYGTEYDLCRRYAEVYGPATGEANGTFPQQLAQIDVNNRAETFITYYPKRTNPTITFASGTNMYFQTMANTGIAITGYNGTSVGTGLNTSNLFFTVASGITTNSLSAIGYIYLTSSNQVVISAEL